MLYGTRGLRNLFRDRSKHPDTKIDSALEAKRMELMSETSHQSKRGFLRALGRLAKPYYWGQKDWKEKAVAWTLLTASIGLTYYTVTDIAVGFNDWNKDAGDFIQASFDAASKGTDAVKAAWDGFGDLMKDLAVLTGKALGVGYVNYKIGQTAVLRWRKWMTEDYEDKWTANKAFYHMQNKENPLDNPDQRIQEDPSKVADFAFDLVNDAFDACVSLVTFGGILWGLSDAQTIMGVEVPKFMFTAVMGYAALGTYLTYSASKPLEKRVQDQQRFEADYRSDLKEMHEKREAIALNNADGMQKGILRKSFNSVYNNTKKIININSYMLALRGGYHRAAGVVPLVVSFPQVVAGKMQMGGIFQVSGAFGEVKNAMSWYVNNATRIRAGTAYMNRLIDIDDALTETQFEQSELKRLSDQRAEQKSHEPAPAPTLGAE